METFEASELAAAPVPVRGARITGRLALEGRAIAEPLVFEDCTFEEEVCLDEATTSSVRLVRCELPALRASNAETRGDVVLDGSTAGHVALAGAHIGGSLRLAGTRLTGDLDISSVRVDQDVACTDGFTVLGGLIAPGARVDGTVDLEGATLEGLGDNAMQARGLRAGGDLLLLRVTANGTIWLTGARIDGSLDLSGAKLCAETHTLIAESMHAGRGTFLAGGFRSRGEVRIVGATLGGPLNLESAELINPDGWALNAWGLEIGMGLWASGLKADGELRLTNARVRGPVHLEAAEVRGRGPEGISIHLWGAECDELLLPVGSPPPPGLVELRGARTRQFTDLGHFYRVCVGDFAYESLGHGSGNLRDRLNWLARAEDGFSPGAYDRLAAVFRSAGREDDARDVAIARERARRRTLHRAGRWTSRFLGATVGHGYRPWRAGAWLAAVVLAGWWLFGSLWRDDMVPAGGAQEQFRPLLFSLDAVLPVVNLGQDDRWAITGGGAQWWYAFSVLAGWALATVLVSALTARLVRD